MCISTIRNIICVMVAIFPVATIAVSCGNTLDSVDADKVTDAPTQVVLGMDAAQTENGMVQMRMQAARMERYELPEDESCELFPDGFMVLAYNEEGLLETKIVSDQAKHTIKKQKDEQWSAYGNVVIFNYINGQKITTDTLYWDRDKKEIYTDCYVTLSSPDGFMQGYGLVSDERATNAQLLRPFDGYAIISNDSTRSVYQDTVNFIGPKYYR
ncbi:MAG: LPS export ABC transporter periplasmic protein LptC [Bacteroidales bacterium]|nr:LPS export ABC transporter periplasmic protein LptC [Bacteroidales bacterium]